MINKFKQICTNHRRKVFGLLACSAYLPVFADSPLPISTDEEAQSGQGILQLFQTILDNEVILFIVIFFGILICIGCIVGAYNSYKRFEEDEKLGKLIVSWIVCALFFVISGAFLYILYQIKSFTG